MDVYNIRTLFLLSNFLYRLITTGLSFGVDAIIELEGTLLLEEIMIAKEVIELPIARTYLVIQLLSMS